MRHRTARPLRVERLERREVFATDFLAAAHNPELAADVNNDSQVTSLDALLVINRMSRQQRGTASGTASAASRFYDVNNDGQTTPADALKVINTLSDQVMAASAPLTPPPSPPSPPSPPLPPSPAIVALAMDDPGKAPGVGSTYQATLNDAELANADNLLTASDVETLLDRAAMASSSNDAIIAIVDRSGRIVGVRVESGVDAALRADPERLAFAIDGAVAKARTAAFFSSNAAPLTSRTIRNISQSTITQREVESWSLDSDPRYVGPGLVAPIGVGGHFPPQTAFTPQVDLFAIEHQSRDSQTHAGADGVKGTADDFDLETRFNANPDFVPAAADAFFSTWPESYGLVAGTAPDLQSRGIATLPGGVPLYKLTVDAGGDLVFGNAPLSDSVNLVGGIGVFFPGEDGYATHEQNFIHSSQLRGKTQPEAARINASKVLESEFIALAAATGGNNGRLINGQLVRGRYVENKNFVRDLSFVNNVLPPAPRFVALTGRIDLVGITLEIYGPTPTRANRAAGIDQVIAVGRRVGRDADISNDFEMPVNTGGDFYLDGQGVPSGWLVAPHASSQPGGLTAADVERIIVQGVAQAEATRAAIRLDVDSAFRPGARTSMVLSVADTNGELLGLFRMPDATIFSIDVSVAKARNTAYYADADDLQAADRVDFNDDGVFGTVSTSLKKAGDTLPLGTALTNRTFRFLVEPRYPTGTALPRNAATGLVNDANRRLRDQKANVAIVVGPESMLQMPGINPVTGEKLDPNNPLSASVYTDPATATVLAFDSFVPTRNFRDPGDAQVVINGTGVAQPLITPRPSPGSRKFRVGTNESNASTVAV
ncbi:MAG: dockerin type I domain-containing protein, partial [Planctomycetaceae bacterium]